MRILWLCNICPPAAAVALGRDYSVREGWITGALNRYLEDADSGLEIGICFPAQGQTAEYAGRLPLHPLTGSSACREVALYGFGENLKTPEIYDPGMEACFARILEDFRPDLVHIFGTEFPHALAMVRAFGKPERTLVGIQGLMRECAASYMADLPDKVIRRVTLRDLLRRDTLRQQQRKFEIRAEREKQVLLAAGHVTGRTGYDRKGSLAVNPGLEYHKMNETMRAGFYEGSWSPAACRRGEIFLSQGDYPLKGFHYLLEAMPRILAGYPQAHICVAGNPITAYGTLKEKLKISGYGNYLRRLIHENGLEDKVRVLGSLNEEQMKEQYLASHVFVCPSSTENSPNSLGEAMLLGVPCAASRTGGIVDMAQEGRSALFFEKGNTQDLADKVLAILRDDALALSLSGQARLRAAHNHDGDANYARMKEIYREILRSAG